MGLSQSANKSVSTLTPFKKLLGIGRDVFPLTCEKFQQPRGNEGCPRAWSDLLKMKDEMTSDN